MGQGDEDEHPEVPGGGLTNKLLEYAGSETPVLAVAPRDGVMTRFVEETGVGVSVPPDDGEGLRSVLRELSGGIFRAPARREEALARYRWRRTAERFAAILDGITATGPTPPGRS